MWDSIEKELKSRGMSQYKLAKKMGVPVSTITELKKGRIKKPSFELICKIADALDVSVDDLRQKNRKGVNI